MRLTFTIFVIASAFGQNRNVAVTIDDLPVAGLSGFAPMSCDNARSVPMSRDAAGRSVCATSCDRPVARRGGGDRQSHILAS